MSGASAEPVTLGNAGFHAGLALGRWYPALKDCISIAVTEQRTKDEIDRLAAAFAREVRV